MRRVRSAKIAVWTVASVIAVISLGLVWGGGRIISGQSFNEYQIGLVEYMRLKKFHFTHVTESTIYPGPVALNAVLSAIIVCGLLFGARYVTTRITRRST